MAGEYMSSLLVASGLPVVGVADPHAIEDLGVAGGGGCGAVGGGGGAAAAISWYTGPGGAAVVAVGAGVY